MSADDEERDGSPLFAGPNSDPGKKQLRATMRRTISGIVPVNFDYSLSTRDNYLDPEAPHVGRYSSIRASLDEAYHGQYCRARQVLQDELISDVNRRIKGGQASPWIIFTAGAMGAGKSHVFSWMAERGVVPMQEVQIIDPDVFKAALPEWPGYLEREPLEAGFHTRKESGYLTEIAFEVALRERKHVWVDGSLRDGEWYREEFQRIRRQHPGYHIAIVHVVADRSVVYRRVAERAKVTGRIVPECEIEDSLTRVPASIELLAPLTDFLAVVDNSDDHSPTLCEYCDLEACHTVELGCEAWTEFSSRLCDEGDAADAADEPESQDEAWTQISRHFDPQASFLLQERG